MDEPGKDYVKWSKSDTKKQILYDPNLNEAHRIGKFIGTESKSEVERRVE